MANSVFIYPGAVLQSNAFVGTTLALGAAPAQTGDIRLSNAATVYGRNFANSADILLLQFHTDDNFYVGSSGAVLDLRGSNVSVQGQQVTPAGGSTLVRLVFGSTSGFGIYIGSGVPTVSAAQGSLYLRSDGSSTATRAYINNSAGSGTTWTNLVTAA